MPRLFERRSNSTGRVIGERDALTNHVRDCARAVDQSEMEDKVFLRFCIDRLVPTPGRRDTRRQRLIRTMRRMEELGILPFTVRGRTFVFGDWADVL